MCLQLVCDKFMYSLYSIQKTLKDNIRVCLQQVCDYMHTVNVFTASFLLHTKDINKSLLNAPCSLQCVYCKRKKPER